MKRQKSLRGGREDIVITDLLFQGFWRNPEQKTSPVPVAIKVLQEGSRGQTKEFLDEARIVSSVDDLCCVKILGICLSAQMMLITPLMPLGCLLEFIRQHKKTIGSDVLLRWCKQIAEVCSILIPIRIIAPNTPFF